MPDEWLPKKILCGEHKSENVPMVIRRSDTRIPSKPSLRTSTSTESWEQITQDRAKWRGLIRREGVLVNMKQTESAKPSRHMHSGKPELRHHHRISEAEQTHAQRKTRAKASPQNQRSRADTCTAENQS